MSQNARGRFLDAAKVDDELRDIMTDIHRQASADAGDGAVPDLRRGASVAGYRQLAKAISSFGIV